MKNYSEATVTASEAFRNKSYDRALDWARTEQSAARNNVSYTINTDSETGDTIVTKHEGLNGGVPPYQHIVHI
jgi:hypothetical protein